MSIELYSIFNLKSDLGEKKKQLMFCIGKNHILSPTSSEIVVRHSTYIPYLVNFVVLETNESPLLLPNTCSSQSGLVFLFVDKASNILLGTCKSL